MFSGIRQVSSPLVLIPAYGRTYASLEEIHAAWDAGKDFKVYGQGCYCSVRDLPALRKDASSVSIYDACSGIGFIV